MRVAQVSAAYPPAYSGTASACYYISVELTRLGHEVTVLVPENNKLEYGKPKDVSLQLLPNVVRVGNASFNPDLFGIDGFDIVHVHHPFLFGSDLVYLASQVNGFPYVLTYHQDLLLPGAMHLVDRLYHRLMECRVLSSAARVLATSLDYARHSRLSGLIDEGRVRVAEVPNGVDPDRFRPSTDQERLRRDLGLDGTERIIVFVGGLDSAHYFKGVPILIDAMGLLTVKGAKLVIIGDGNLRKTYERYAHESGVADKVLFRGRVPDYALPKYYAASDLLVLPSITLGEAFGIVCLEAMACGKPVIASNLPGVRTIVEHGENGFLVRPGNALDLSAKITTLLEDHRMAKIMGARGRAKIERSYTWGKIVERLVEIYSEVLQ